MAEGREGGTRAMDNSPRMAGMGVSSPLLSSFCSQSTVGQPLGAKCETAVIQAGVNHNKDQEIQTTILDSSETENSF